MIFCCLYFLSGIIIGSFFLIIVLFLDLVFLWLLSSLFVLGICFIIMIISSSSSSSSSRRRRRSSSSSSSSSSTIFLVTLFKYAYLCICVTADINLGKIYA